MKKNPLLTTKFGNVVRRLRTQAEFSQEGFADHCGIHRASMGSIERGELNVTLETIEKIVGGLKMSYSEFFVQFENEPEPAKLRTKRKYVKND